MSTPLLIALVLVSASICPLMMWIGQRRGRPSPCCPPRRADGPDVSVGETHHAGTPTSQTRELSGSTRDGQ